MLPSILQRCFPNYVKAGMPGERTLDEANARQAALSGDSRMEPRSMPASELRRRAADSFARPRRALCSELALSSSVGRRLAGAAASDAASARSVRSRAIAAATAGDGGSRVARTSAPSSAGGADAVPAAAPVSLMGGLVPSGCGWGHSCSLSVSAGGCLSSCCSSAGAAVSVAAAVALLGESEADTGLLVACDSFCAAFRNQDSFCNAPQMQRVR